MSAQIIYSKIAPQRSGAPSTTMFSDCSSFVSHYKDASHKVVNDYSDADRFSFCSYGTHWPHMQQSAIMVTGFVIELEEALTDECFAEIGERIDFCCVIYTAFNSGNGGHRVCIAIPLPTPMSVQDFKNADIALRVAKLLNVKISRDSLEPDRYWPEPCCPEHAEDAHLLVARPEYPPLDARSLPKVAPGDRERFCGLGWQDIQESLKNKQSDDAVTECISMYVHKRFGGVDPIFTESRFYIYERRHWRCVSVMALLQDIMLSYSGGKINQATASRMINTMKVRFHRDIFPAGANEAALSSLKETRIALANCTIDPIAGLAVPDQPEDYLRARLPYAFIPDAQCPRFHQFLAEVFRDDQDRPAKIDFLQEMMGYLLVPSTRFQVMFWLYGAGANGKSVLLDLITALLGKENVSNVSLSRLGKPFQLVELVSKLANISDEIGAQAALNDDVLKQTASGGRQTVERKGEQPFSCTLYARIIAATNHVPRIKDNSEAFFRRLKVLTFNRYFSPEEQDRELLPTLLRELPGILNWALVGLQRLEEQGAFTELTSSDKFVAQYKLDCDPVKQFVQDMLILPNNPDYLRASKNGRPPKELVSSVYNLYREYCSAKGFAPLNASYLGRQLQSFDIISKPSNGKTYYPIGVRSMEAAGLLPQPYGRLCRSLNASDVA